MQELDKFIIKKNVIPNGLEKYLCFSINNNVTFIHSFQFLSSSLDSLVKNLDKKFYPYEYMNDYKKFKEKLRYKEKFYSSITGKKLMTENMNIFLRFGKKI